MILDIPGVSERRQTPRYEVKLDIDLVLDNGSILTVTSQNISSCGLQIICDSWVTDEIEPRGIQSHSVSHIRFKAVTELPIENDKGKSGKKLYSTCRIMSVQRLSQDEFMLNLAFIDFQNGSESSLDEFLDQFEKKKVIRKIVRSVA
jgi:hypothetical protein